MDISKYKEYGDGTYIGPKIELHKLVKLCPHCGEGQLVATDAYVILTDPPLYENKCDKCGEIYNLDRRYPSFVYIEVED